LRSRSLLVVLFFLFLFCTVAAAWAGGPSPEIRLYDGTGAGVIARLGPNPRTIDTESTIVLEDWTNQHTYKSFIELQMPEPGQQRFWEGAVMCFSGIYAGTLDPWPIALSWGIYDNWPDIRWALYVKPRDDAYFQQVDLSTDSTTLPVANSNNCWFLHIPASRDVVPEPASALVLDTGFLSLIGLVRRRRA